MNYDALVKFVQEHFTDGLALVIGSGLSSAEDIPGMPALATQLSSRSTMLTGDSATHWKLIRAKLDDKKGLEAALQDHAPNEELEAWIVQETTGLLLPKEREIISAVLRGEHTLRLTTFLNKVLKPATGLPILTTNYDRLIEVACEMAGLHVDTTAIGQYAGTFDHKKSCMGSCQGITSRGKTPVLSHLPRAIVLKPHGSFDWYKTNNDARRCSLDLDAERLIITPGLNKYRAGYNAPFDKHRDLANDYIKQAGRLLVVGYGFNDDHLQTHLLKRIQDGTPTLILNRSASLPVEQIAKTAPRCVLLSKPNAYAGVVMVTNGHQLDQAGPDLWDIGILTKELLT